VLHGASLKISPSWLPETTIIDIQWDDDALSAPEPVGKWWGQLAFLGGTGSDEGEWQWDAAVQELELWVPVPGSARRLIAARPFDFPVVTGMAGDGKLQPGLVPTTEAPTFTWEGFATGFDKTRSAY